MTSYRFKRRAFLSAVGGAVGLEVPLGNLEAAAQGTPSPPRFLLMHWPLGTLKYHYVPTGSRTDFVMSRVLQPFEAAGLRNDMITLYGLSHHGLDSGNGGSHEFGTVAATTGASSPGTRSNGGEGDDAVAGGPSFDQIVSDAARSNLELTLLGHFGVHRLDPSSIGVELADSMRTEAQAFVRGTLWSAPVGDLVTSRRTFLDQRPADLYGIAFPPPGSTPDAQGWAEAELPATRAGLLTQAATLAAVAPTGSPRIRRGLWIRTLLCLENPLHPEVLPYEIELPPNPTERMQAEALMSTAPCSSCHSELDSFGLALGQFDNVGGFQTVDELDRPIDPAVELPSSVGGGYVANAAELGAFMAEPGGRFSPCLARSYLEYALAEGSVDFDSCDVEPIASDPENASFSNLIRAIALSKTFGTRRVVEP